MADRQTCPACGQSFGSQREADDHGAKVHGGAAGQKGGEKQPEEQKPEER